jgi:hypothetical protein
MEPLRKPISALDRSFDPHGMPQTLTDKWSSAYPILLLTLKHLAWIIHEQNEGCLSARGQGWPVVSASLRAR